MDLLAKIFGIIWVQMIVTYYRIRHPFKWRQKLLAKYRPPDEMMLLSARKPGKSIKMGGDLPTKDVYNLTDVMRSFSFGNIIVPDSDGNYISISAIKPPKSEVH